jgi:D-apionolactonase
MTSKPKYYSTLEIESVWHGNHSENDSRITLRAGDLSMIYENGNLRYISLGNREMIRMIYSAVRDREWLTIKPVMLDEKIETYADSFRITYSCKYQSGEIDFLAVYSIEGSADNTLVFSFEGEALNTFEKSRIGFCVLHPAEWFAGKQCIIAHSDDAEETLTFPVYISPDQPFLDIRSMKWKNNDIFCTLGFSGDVFETEDQRNWTDDSYKTYCTPQSLPCPVTIREGQKISQRIELKVESGNVNTIGDNAEIKISVSPERTFGMPLIGIGRSTRTLALTENEIAILKNLSFDHSRVDLYLFTTDWRNDADKAADEAVKLNYPLELALFFDENFVRQSDDFATWIADREPVVAVISLFHKTEAVTPDRLTDYVAPGLKQTLPHVRIVCGTNANFAQLNGNFPSSGFIDQICYSVHPQEHASDNSTLVENLRAQSDSVLSARHYSGGKDILVSPVNIQRRFNANIENFETLKHHNSMPSQVDMRQMSLFGAGWTAGSLKYLGEAGVKGITFFETTGERGIIQGDFNSRWPEQFKTVKGMIFPVYHLFNWLLKDKSCRLIHTVSSKPLEVDCLALSNDSRIKLIAVNFTSTNQKLFIHGLAGECRIKMLNAGSYAEAAFDLSWIDKNWQNLSGVEEQMVLEPYSLSFIEGFPGGKGV